MPQTDASQITPASLAQVFAKLIAAEPSIVKIIGELAPLSAALPAPFNVLGDPLITQAVAVLPTLLPIMTELEAVLTAVQSAPATTAAQ